MLPRLHAAATAEKVVECPNFLQLEEGARVTVFFENQNTASASLNVNGTGAVSIFGSNTWGASTLITFVYTGSGWFSQTSPYSILELGSINGVSNTTVLNIEYFNFLYITNLRESLWRAPTYIPVEWIVKNYGQVIGIESWDGSRYRVKFEQLNDTHTTITITAGYYSGTVYFYGIK